MINDKSKNINIFFTHAGTSLFATVKFIGHKFASIRIYRSDMHICKKFR